MGKAKKPMGKHEDKHYIGYVKDDFSETSKLYAHTNEQFGVLVESMDNCKSVLTVAASGDQLLNLRSKDIYQVDTFDINRYTDYYINLRLAAIKSIPDLQELWYFLFKINKKGYENTKYELNRESFAFWDYIFNKYTIEEIFHIFFRADVDDLDILDNNSYLDISVLEDFKDNIKYLERLHFNTHIFNLHSFIEGKKYDAIILSNIYDYVDSKKFLRYLRILKNYLTEKGKIYYSYQYDLRTKDDITEILMKKDYKDDIAREEFEEFKDIIEDTELLRLENKYQYNKNKYYSKDAVLVLHK